MFDGIALIVYCGDNMKWLPKLPDKSIDLIYIDPPFNTGVLQLRKRFHNENGKKVEDESFGFYDNTDNYEEFIEARLQQAKRLLKDNGSLFFHIDYREAHYCKILLDKIFGRSNFMNEIIWAYDYGARSKKKWSCKHDTIFWYVMDTNNYTFNYEEVDRIPYMAPELVGEEKAEKGKTVTDVWWHTIVATNSKEKTNYTTQKPLGILKRIVKVHSNPGDMLLDFFAGSGSFGQAAVDLERQCVLMDDNANAIQVMHKRFEDYNVCYVAAANYLYGGSNG